MKNVRVKELEDFSNDFLRKLGEDEEKIMMQRPVKTEINEDINEELNDISKRRSLNLPNFSITNLYKKKNKKKEPLVIKYIIILIKYSLKMYLNL